MTPHLTRIALSSLVTLVVMSLVIFVALRILPGDVAMQFVGDGSATEEDLERIRERLGTNRPIMTQYFDWLGNLLRLEPGTSMVENSSILDEFKSRFPVTLEIAVLASLAGGAIALPVGVIASTRRHHISGILARVLGIVTLALPSFLIGTLLILFALKLFEWTPPIGYQSFAENPGNHVQQIFMPVSVMALGSAAFLSRLVSASVDDVLHQDFVRTARAKGLPANVILSRHVLRNALLPVITVYGYQFAVLLGGSVVIEQLFGLPGLGRWFVQAINQRDYPVVQFLAMFYIVVTIGMNLIVDFTYNIVDPRTR